jgi:hypothetical protein
LGIAKDKQAAILKLFSKPKEELLENMVVQVRTFYITRVSKIIRGKITVTSSLNHGATFSLVLPLAIQPEMELSNSLPIQPRQYIPIDKNETTFSELCYHSRR